jgi:hypothetical protein
VSLVTRKEGGTMRKASLLIIALAMSITLTAGWEEIDAVRVAS